MRRRKGGSRLRVVRRKNAALAGIVLGSLSWFVLLFVCFGGEVASCPEGGAGWVEPVAVACALVASLGMAAAVRGYRETAGQPSGEWLLGAAGLYVTTLAWTATVTGAAALFFVDLCSL